MAQHGNWTMKKSQAGLVKRDPEGAALFHPPPRDLYPGAVGPAGCSTRGLVRQYEVWPGEEAGALFSAPYPTLWLCDLVKFLYLNLPFVK